MRIENEEFSRKSLRVHTLAPDVPLHDAWAARLEGGGDGRTLMDFQALLSFDQMERVNPIVRAVFGLRHLLGRLLRWDKRQAEAPDSSYIHGLSDEDRSRSLVEPGNVVSTSFPIRVIYLWEDEALYESINATAHVLSAISMERSPGGYTVCWGVHVKRTGWLTPLYMALIDPFRRLVIYPGITRAFERAWASRNRP